MFSTVEVDAEAMQRQAARHFASCTELAAVIHRNSALSFRSAHRIVGNLVLRALKQGKDATGVDAALVNESAREVCGEDLAIDDAMVRGALDPESFVQAHDVAGGPARAPMQAALKRARQRGQADRERVDTLARGLSDAESGLAGRVADYV